MNQLFKPRKMSLQQVADSINPKNIKIIEPSELKELEEKTHTGNLDNIVVSINGKDPKMKNGVYMTDYDYYEEEEKELTQFIEDMKLEDFDKDTGCYIKRQNGAPLIRNLYDELKQMNKENNKITGDVFYKNFMDHY